MSVPHRKPYKAANLSSSMKTNRKQIHKNASVAEKLSRYIQDGLPFIVTPEDDFIQVRTKSSDLEKRDASAQEGDSDPKCAEP